MKTATDSLTVAHEQNTQGLTSSSLKKTFNGDDFFNQFYKAILSADSLVNFEANLFSFMHAVLEQDTCLFYSNINQSQNKTSFILQRGSYSRQIDSSVLRSTFPTMISLDFEPIEVSSRPINWQDTQQTSSLQHNFFALGNPGTSQTHQSIQDNFEKYQTYICCGMLLRSSSEVHGIVLYERPLYHSYLNTALRLQQFQEFLSLALAHNQTVNYATLDQLTNLHRKYYFLNLVERQFLHHPKLKYQLLIIDIDFFKKFNDTFGHLEGDHCLQAVAKAIKDSVRTHDFTGRFGGEEFICLVQSHLSQVLPVAERIHQTISRIKLKNSADLKIPIPTVSIGIASLRQEETLNELIERADKALYQAKQAGRNRTVVAPS